MTEETAKQYKKCCDALGILQSIRGGKVEINDTLDGKEYERLWTGESSKEVLYPSKGSQSYTLFLSWNIWVCENGSLDIVCLPSIAKGDSELLYKALIPLIPPLDFYSLLKNFCKKAFSEYGVEIDKTFIKGFLTANSLAYELNDTIGIVTSIYKKEVQDYISRCEAMKKYQ